MSKPYIVIEWNDTESEARGWLCIHNLVKGYCGGGTRMHPSVTREEVIRLAEVMAYKRNAAENSRKGGMKAGIVYDYKAPDARDVLKRFIIAMRPYIEIGLNIGSDLGTRETDIREIFEELGMEEPQTKSMKTDPVVKKGIEDLNLMLKADYKGWPLNDCVTGFGVAASCDEAWKQMGMAPGASVVVQGFGCVGKSCCARLTELGYKIVGIADANCFVYAKDGLDVASLIENCLPRGEMDQSKFEPSWEVKANTEWVDAPCDIFIPAALEDVVNAGNVDRLKIKLLCEGANIPVTSDADKVLFEKGIRLVPDFIANIGAIRFFYAVMFGDVKATPEAVIDDIEALCRKNVTNLFRKAAEEKRYEREIALEVFEPTVYDLPDC